MECQDQTIRLSGGDTLPGSNQENQLMHMEEFEKERKKLICFTEQWGKLEEIKDWPKENWEKNWEHERKLIISK